MRILILGYSRIARKRIIPAIEKIKDIRQIDIASKTSASSVSLSDAIKGDVFSDYNEALSKSKADIVYISTVNSAHNELAKKALEKGFHVIVDKPAFTNLRDAKKSVDLAKKQKRCLAEATVYVYHPQVALMKNVFSAANKKPSRLTAIFSFPPLDNNDFRYAKASGGGALQDLGSYAVTPGRLFFEEEPKEVYCRILDRGGRDKIEISFSMLAVYSGGRSVIGHFGFNTAYRNFLGLLGEGISVESERVFTIPCELENELHIRQGNEKKLLKVPKADCFELFLRKVLETIGKGDYKEFSDNLLSDASVSHKLRLAALKE